MHRRTRRTFRHRQLLHRVPRNETSTPALQRVLRSDNGPEFLFQAVMTRAASRTVLTYMPGQPWHNGYVESFNGHLRDEYLIINSFFGVWRLRWFLIVCSLLPGNSGFMDSHNERTQKMGSSQQRLVAWLHGCSNARAVNPQRLTARRSTECRTATTIRCWTAIIRLSDADQADHDGWWNTASGERVARVVAASRAWKEPHLRLLRICVSTAISKAVILCSFTGLSVFYEC